MLHVNLFVQILSDLILILSDLIWSYLILSDFWKWVAPAGETTHLKKGSEKLDSWKWVAPAGETTHLKKGSEKSDSWKWVAPAGETTHLKKGSEKSDSWKCIAPAGETTHLKKGSDKVGIFQIFWNSQTDGQIVPTPRGSVLHHTKPSQVPYNAKNRFLAISSNIPYYSYYFPIFLWK